MKELIKVQFCLYMRPRYERLITILCDCSLQIAQVLQVFDAFLETLDGFDQVLDFLDYGGISHMRLSYCRSTYSSESN
jgi:hypothetical protein